MGWGWFSSLVDRFGFYIPWAISIFMGGFNTKEHETFGYNELNATEPSRKAYPGLPVTYKELMAMFKNKTGNLKDFLIQTNDLGDCGEAWSKEQDSVGYF